MCLESTDLKEIVSIYFHWYKICMVWIFLRCCGHLSQKYLSLYW